MQTKQLRPGTFRSFPEFSKLTLNDKRVYESHIKEYPAISDLSFATIMTWWNLLDSAAVSRLNGNLILSYWYPGIEKYSGLSLIGTNQVDESICTIFDYLRERGDPVRLVHVPEFVVSELKYPELFRFKEERAFDEYIIPVDAHYPLNRLSTFRKMRVKNFLRRVNEEDIVVRSIDLDDEESQKLLLEKAIVWEKKGTINQLYKLEAEALEYAVRHATLIGLENVCLFVNNQLQGFCLYERSHDKRYVIIGHARAGNELPRTLDYMCYAFAEWLASHGVMYANVEMDLGLPLLRMIKLALGPTNYFRKYTIKPVDQ